MKYSLAFDVFDTLINTAAIREALVDYVDDHAGSFYKLWRTKQLEYSFRKSLMKMPADFSLCTKESLDYCCYSFDIYLSGRDKKNLLKKFNSLPAFQNTEKALEQAKSEGHKLYILTNGNKDVVSELLHHNQLFSYFKKIITAEEAGIFKPSPVVYNHFIESTGSQKETSWLISGNSFDIIGAANAGLNTVWVQRSSENIFDPWNIQPNSVIGTLEELMDELNEYDEEDD